MILPELSRKNIDGTAPSPSFFRGLYRRVTQPNKNKVFVVGYHKTGTTSLTKALLVLGYRVCGSLNQIKDFNPSVHSRSDLFKMALPLLKEYDVFEDTPWFMFYRELLEEHPDGKFILTVRPSENWYKSVVKHFGGYDKWNYHSWIYDGLGDPVGNRQIYIEKYEQHNKEVINYFKNKGKDILIMELPNDFNWKTLCGFLDCKKPFGNFPHANSVGSRETKQRKLLDLIKRSFYRI